MLAQPPNGLCTIAPLVAKRIELPARAAAPAHILNCNMIASPCEPHRMRVNNGGGNVAPIRLAHQECGPRSFTRGIIMIGNKRGPVAELAFNPTLKPNFVSAIDERHLQASCLGSKLYMATSSSAIRPAASSDQRSPFCAVACDGSPSTPLGEMSRVSHAKFANEPSGLSSSG